MSSAARRGAAAALIAMIALLAACGSVPVPATPDGRARTPVNDQASIDLYTTRTARDAARIKEDGATQRQLDALRRDVAALQRYLGAGAAATDGTPPRTRTTSTISGTSSSSSVTLASTGTAHPLDAAGNQEALEVRRQSIVFRFADGGAHSAFLPSPHLRAELLRAARAARRIEVRGRPDGALAGAASGRIALARAQQARQYLLGHGIAAKKIRLSYLAAGDFSSDNATAAGRTSNRRVEIEAIGLPASSFATFRHLTGGSLP